MDIALTPQIGVKVSPRLVAANHILEMSSLELQQAIAQEIADNPALEKLEEPTCSVCGGSLQGSICPHCLSEQKKDDPNADNLLDPVEEQISASSSSSSAEAGEFDPLTQVADQMSLAEYLLIELRPVLKPADLPIAEYLVGNLDEHGWLSCSLEETADFFGIEIKRVEAVLRQIQTLEPIGIGARNLRECMLIQLDYLESEQGIIQPHARAIIENYLVELGEHKFGKIAHDLKISHEEVGAVWDFIKRELNPFPARQFGPDLPAETKSSYVLPDVIISTRERAFEVEVVESKRYFLRITPLYAQLSAELERDGNRYTEDEKRHIQHYVSRAKLFIQNINQRRQTLHRITSCLVGKQKDFLVDGIRHLQPLTRAAVAAELGLHESTVSRATASKFVMLPNRQVVPFSVFFSASLSVKDVIKEMIDREPNPMTDQEIADELAERGINIARRTVAKYREQLGILPSSLR